MKTLEQHIEITPGISGGKPRIAGHRITVKNIVIWHERMGKSADEIATEYDLTLADVYAALAYYFDHRAEINQSIEESKVFVKTLRKQTSSKLSARLQNPSYADTGGHSRIAGEGDRWTVGEYQRRSK